MTVLQFSCDIWFGGKEGPAVHAADKSCAQWSEAWLEQTMEGHGDGEGFSQDHRDHCFN